MSSCVASLVETPVLILELDNDIIPSGGLLMNQRRASLLFGVLALIALGLTPRDLAAQPPPLGPETRVDTLLGRHPACPKVDVSRKGGAAEIAWDYGGLPPFDVYVRHYAPNG